MLLEKTARDRQSYLKTCKTRVELNEIRSVCDLLLIKLNVAVTPHKKENDKSPVKYKRHFTLAQSSRDEKNFHCNKIVKCARPRRAFG